MIRMVGVVWHGPSRAPRGTVPHFATHAHRVDVATDSPPPALAACPRDMPRPHSTCYGCTPMQPTPRLIATSALAAIASLALVPSSPAQDGGSPGQAPSQPPAPRAAAAPAPELAALSFLEGHWITQLPNGMVSEESWLPARGKSMLGSFRQTRPDGKPAFFEFSQIVVEGDRVVLRQIHVHGSFETDARRKDPMTLRLLEASDNSATFVPIEDAGKANSADLARVTYSVDDSDALRLRIESKPMKQTKPDEAIPGDVEAKPVVIEISMKRAR